MSTTRKTQPSASTPMSVPKSFWESYMDHHGLMKYLDWTEERFFQEYTSGRLPLGCNLMPLFKVPMIVFRLSDLIAWENDGFPAQAGALELQAEVSAALVSAFESEGVIFPDKASEYN